VGKERLVLDLSCRLRDGKYWVVTDRWQNFSQLALSEVSDTPAVLLCQSWCGAVHCTHKHACLNKVLGGDGQVAALLTAGAV